jgi:hypothetical protein
MEMNEKLARELKKKFEVEQMRHEAEVIDHWRLEVDAVYKKKYESLASVQVEMKNLMDRMNNRAIMLRRQVKEDG